VFGFAVAALSLLALDALLVFRDAARVRRKLLLLSMCASAGLGLASWIAHRDEAPGSTSDGYLIYFALASAVWIAGAAMFLLPRCTELFPARLFCGPRLVAGIASALGGLLRGVVDGEWDLGSATWLFVAHLIVSFCAFAFGLLVLVVYFIFGHALPHRDTPQA
jgi:hypothetical protein